MFQMQNVSYPVKLLLTKALRKFDGKSVSIPLTISS